ncbi:acyloxyacyl hydrolase [Winogradskyella litoriviva]|uniref:Acyloxyacyl hydrolase n=1 Tax=Winogradskyella litoriviva TaxID=1220182 RepID=A0ABX2E454_9FLAO|nr:acyloxyacyl hydrolase [Winogradskyella litoriviva]NRD23279.1 acyloxyacyl hydrolase [Winogradskyella litoriviva]
MRNYFISFLLLSSIAVCAQKEMNNAYLDFNYFGGNIALHNNDILHLIKGHPEGFILSYNKKTFGKKTWEQRFGYPDYGLSFIYQDLKNEILGDNYALYAHYNFYFFKRNVMLRIGQGLAYNTNPYDKIVNPKNIAFGSDILSATYLLFNYKKERLFNRFGLQGGLTLTHYSNANVKAPNTSVNTITLNVGLTYNLDNENQEFIDNLNEEKFTEKVKFNLAFRSGINQSDIIGSGQFPFYIISGYVDKRLSHVSAIQFGTDVFFSNFLKELIYYKLVAFPEEDVSGDEDYKRVGLFVGHELFINKISVESQLGYYVYYPYDFEGRTYIRVGLKRYFGEKFFGAVTLKSHGAKAESVAFGVGVRL